MIFSDYQEVMGGIIIIEKLALGLTNLMIQERLIIGSNANYVSLQNGLQLKQLFNAPDKKRTLLDCLLLSSKERLSFYEQNKSNSVVLLNAINFFNGVVSGDDGANGYFSFGSDGRGQMIPKNAIPRIKADTLQSLHADNNKLSLISNTYYAYKGNDGKNYVCAFNGEVISRAFTEALLGNDKENVSVECRSNMSGTMSIISNLATGSIGALHMPERQLIRKRLESIGIKPGEFSISVDGEERTYYLAESGKIFTEKSVMDTIEMYNNNIWLNHRSVGDKITVWGKEYVIDEEGHIHVPTEDFWVSEECNYGN